MLISMLQRIKAIHDKPYTQKEAEAAIGLHTDNGPPQTAGRAVQEMEVEIKTIMEYDSGAI
jgi:bud site selection protein 20